MGLSTKEILIYKGATKHNKGFTNANGTETPNLDFLKSELAKAEQNIQYWKNMSMTWTAKRDNWQNEYWRLNHLWNKALTNKKKNNLAIEMGKAQNSLNIAKTEITKSNNEVKRFENEKLFIQGKINDYQKAVAQAISVGVTDGGATEIAELEVEKAKSELKNLKSKPIRTIALIGGAVVLGVVGLIIFRRR